MVFLKHIPDNLNKMMSLTSYFSQFGEVVHINVNTLKSTAMIRFEDEACAIKASQCEGMILDNPQIKLYYNPGDNNTNSPVKKNYFDPASEEMK